MHPANKSEGGLFEKLEELVRSSRWVGKPRLSLIREDKSFKAIAMKAAFLIPLCRLNYCRNSTLGVIMQRLKLKSLVLVCLIALDN